MKQLPASASLSQLRRQAKDLLKQVKAWSPEALERLRAAHPRFSQAAGQAGPATLSLSDAQLVVAREYGLASWPRLKAHVEELEAVRRRVDALHREFAAADKAGRAELMKPLHTKERLKDFGEGAETLSEQDAKLLVANAEGYALWEKYESYLRLDPAVREVIEAVRRGDLRRLKSLLQDDPAAANPRWVGDAPEPVPNDSTPLFRVSQAVFERTNPKDNAYALVEVLAQAGAELEIGRGLPLSGAVSYGVVEAVRGLLDAGARVDGFDGDGVPMAYALFFGHTEVAELLASRGARLDLRFAAGLGLVDRMRSFFRGDGSLTEDAGTLADPYENRFRCERTRENVLNQALLFATLNNRLAAVELLLEQGAEPTAVVAGMPTKLTSMNYARYGARELGHMRMLALLEEHERSRR